MADPSQKCRECLNQVTRFVRNSYGCWSWLGAKTAQGYGRLSLGGRGAKIERAHRVSWMLHNGPIPDGMFVCHKCDNPECARPDHLFLGDNAANVRDSVSKSRHRAAVKPESYEANTGRPRGTSKYTQWQCERVAKMLRLGWAHRAIEARLGVPKSMVPHLAARATAAP